MHSSYRRQPVVSRRRALGLGGAAALFASAGLAGCAPKSEMASLIATTGMVDDAVRAVLGIGDQRYVTKALMGAGVDPHSYRETRVDVEALLTAQAVFWNGLYLEAQLEELLLKLGEEKQVVAVAEAVPTELRRANPDYPGRYDPHVWMAPELWRYAVGAVAVALERLIPARAEELAANAAAYVKELETLQSYSAELLAKIPEERRVLVTAHDAFGYFGDAYAFEVVGVQGVSTESEAGLARIGALVDLLVERRIPVVFIESSVSARNVEALIEGARAKGAEVAIGGELFSDAMGPDGTYEGTYIGMIDHNITSIARAFGVEDAPVGGMRGALGGRQ